jgi:predicted ATPase with chaperone activity
MRVARTIADLACEESVGRRHLEEAVAYRFQEGFS